MSLEQPLNTLPIPLYEMEERPVGAGGIVKTALVWQRETGETDLEKVFRIVLRRRKKMSPHMEAMLT